jgi:hypothetical protein
MVELSCVIERLVSGRRREAPSGTGRMIASRGFCEKQRREPASLKLAGNDANPGDAERARHACFHRAAGGECQGFAPKLG